MFDDIITNESDLRFYLGEDNCGEIENRSLSIKSYIKFCHETDIQLWSPIQSNVEQGLEFEPLGLGCEIEEIENHSEPETKILLSNEKQGTIRPFYYESEQDDPEFELGHRELNGKPKRKKKRTEPAVRKNKENHNAELEAMIEKACDQCNPGALLRQWLI